MPPLHSVPAFHHHDLWDAIIIGAGVSGAATAYHLAHTAPTSRILILDAGNPGAGRVGAAVVHEAPHQRIGLGDEETYTPYVAGSGVYPKDMGGPQTIKMVDIAVPARVKEFVEHHGEEGAHRYIRMAAEGLAIQRELAKKVFGEEFDTKFRQMGSLIVTEHEDNVNELWEEYEECLRVGYPCEWWDRVKVIKEHGTAARFTAGIYSPDNAIIDSTAYAVGLVKAACQRNPNCHFQGGVTVVDVQDHGFENGATVVLKDGSEVYARDVVIATGGFYADRNLAGILRPCYSYLSAIKNPDIPQEEQRISSPNYLTLGFCYDWAWVDGWLRVSGEDGFSSLRAPRAEERCKALTEWALEKYPQLYGPNMQVKTLYGVYTETPDKIPVVGRPRSDSAMCYLVGCNAWAQGPLSYCASLIPGLLGWTAPSASFWTPERIDMAEFVSIQRFRLPDPIPLRTNKVSSMWTGVDERNHGEVRGGHGNRDLISSRGHRVEMKRASKL